MIAKQNDVLQIGISKVFTVANIAAVLLFVGSMVAFLLTLEKNLIARIVLVEASILSEAQVRAVTDAKHDGLLALTQGGIAACSNDKDLLWQAIEGLKQYNLRHIENHSN